MLKDKFLRKRNRIKSKYVTTLFLTFYEANQRMRAAFVVGPPVVPRILGIVVADEKA